MTLDEVEKYISNGSRSQVCIMRKPVDGLSLLIMSFYIMGKPGSYILSVEFDPIDLVDQGEGWIWHSYPMSIDALTNIIEQHLNSPIKEWENITKSGLLSVYDEEINNEQYLKEESVFIDDLRFGEVLLPLNLSWKKKPL
ncbi:hypothetical protein [Zooshikella ganghwensis]|uniref:hypothetical protein n=1 Tax=Zooshikella ganghwensis TaxID=202772 RepID=UPI000485A92B|nr:hypothetical protein [Zooshikella ganghwensis]